ncbi:MAG: hypothetical protein CMM57_10795 [Rhodospirillaceae bacterium]|nr:hypothetical protein [Rhodospirillaceae bacterium]
MTINVAIEPILMQVRRTLEGCHRLGRKMLSAVKLVRTDRPAANGDDQQQKHKPCASDAAKA